MPSSVYPYIAQIGRSSIESVQALGRMGVLCWHSLTQRNTNVKQELSLIAAQLYSVGVLSLLIIALSGLFIGMVLALQGYTVLSRFGATEALGQLVSLSLIRELGPVVAALLFAGRAGSALTAEVGFMKATEQLAALEMMAVNPLTYVIRPRLIAGIIAMPILALIFNMVAIYSAWYVCVALLHVDSGSFWANMQNAVDFRLDVINGLIKSVCFGVVVTLIALYQGYASIPTTEGIGRATTHSVVLASISILGLDFLLTAFMFGT